MCPLFECLNSKPLPSPDFGPPTPIPIGDSGILLISALAVGVLYKKVSKNEPRS